MNRRVGPVLCSVALLGLSAAVSAFDAGTSVYNSKCIICHGSGAFGAPKTGDRQAWKPRIAKGIDALLASVINGKGKMPPRGFCTECTDSDLKDAVRFIISAAKNGE